MAPHPTLSTALAALLVAAAGFAEAQVIAPTQLPRTLYPDAWLVPRGVLRVAFEPQYLSYDQRFNRAGDPEPLGTDLTADSAGSQILPTLVAPEQAVRDITGLTAYRITIGELTSELEGDVRSLPFAFQFGLSNRLNLSLRVPFYTTRVQANAALDSTTANAGWNQAAAEAGNATAVAQIQQLLSQLEAAAVNIEAQIAGGAFGCPGSAQCTQAQDLVGRTRLLATRLQSLTGVAAGGGVGPLPPFAPLQASSAGQAILAAIQSIGSELQTFGAVRPTATLPLPAGRVDADEFQSVLGSNSFGYDAFGIEFLKYRQRLGDIEVGLKWGLAQSPHFRATLGATVRLPTATVDSPDHFVDIGTGEKQLDVVADIEAVWAPGSVLALALAGSYTAQLPDRRVLRLTSPHQPIATAASEFEFNRNLGDVLRLSAYPSLRLSSSFTGYLSAHYFRKSADNFAFASGGSPGGDASILGTDTEAESLSLGGGIHYYSVGSESSLPVSAGIDYRAAFRGEGGLTPKDASVNFYLRLHFRLLGPRGVSQE